MCLAAAEFMNMFNRPGLIDLAVFSPWLVVGSLLVGSSFRKYVRKRETGVL